MEMIRRVASRSFLLFLSHFPSKSIFISVSSYPVSSQHWINCRIVIKTIPLDTSEIEGGERERERERERFFYSSCYVFLGWRKRALWWHATEPFADWKKTLERDRAPPTRTPRSPPENKNAINNPIKSELWLFSIPSFFLPFCSLFYS